MENRSSLGVGCKNTHIAGTMKCYCDRCNRHIHHLCAIIQNFIDKDNELNIWDVLNTPQVYALLFCSPRTEHE